MGDAETMAELETLSREIDPITTIAESARDATCLALVDIAMANDIDVGVTYDD